MKGNFMSRIFLFVALAIIFASSCGKENNLALLSAESQQWLKAEAARQLKGCRRIAHDGTVLYTPDGEGRYGALWTRGFSYMVENAFALIPTDQIKAAIRYLLNGQRKDGCIPDRVQVDGLAVYSAGPVDHPLGDPPTDNSQFMVKLVADYVNGSGDVDFFRRHSNQLIAAMNFTPRSASGLVYIDPTHPHSPYGFTDTIAKTGELLFSSLLYWEACQHLVALFKQMNDGKTAQDFEHRAALIGKNIFILWDKDAGMFRAASVDCRQIDIWGNAYAVYINFPLANKKDRIMAFLAKNYAQFVMKGQIRHLLSPEHWERTLVPITPETYQNGAYWGTASGWVACALAEKYPHLSRTIFAELTADYKKNGAYECINSDYAKLKNYVVSVTNPLGVLNKQAFITLQRKINTR